MKRLFFALLLCLPIQVFGDTNYLSDPMDMVGTPLQQDFKLLYREVYAAETLQVEDTGLLKQVRQEWFDRAGKFLANAIFAPYHQCEEVDAGAPRLGYQRNDKGTVYIPFECAVGDKNRGYVAFLSLGEKYGSHQYLVKIFWRQKPKNNIWDD